MHFFSGWLDLHFGHLAKRWSPGPLMGLSVLMIALALGLGGCSPYQLQGKVISGPKPLIEAVDDDDPRLAKAGLSGAVIHLTVDPREIRPKRYDPEMTDDQGCFAIAINEPGAGLLEYQLQIVARYANHKPTIQYLPMPWSGKRLLIVVSPGQDQYQPPQDILRETMKLGDQLQR